MTPSELLERWGCFSCGYPILVGWHNSWDRLSKEPAISTRATIGAFALATEKAASDQANYLRRVGCHQHIDWSDEVCLDAIRKLTPRIWGRESWRVYPAQRWMPSDEKFGAFLFGLALTDPKLAAHAARAILLRYVNRPGVGPASCRPESLAGGRGPDPVAA